MLSDCHSYRFLLLPALLASLLLCSCRCSDSCGDTPAPQTDSIVHVVTGYLVNEDLKGAMAVIESCEAAGMLRAYDAEMLRLRVMSRDESRMAEAEQRYLSLLETDLSQPQMQTVLERLSYIARQRNDDRAQLDYGSRYIDVCLAMGETSKALAAQAEIGSVLIRLGRVDEGMDKIDDAIGQLDKVRRFAELDACVLAMKSKIRTLINLSHYDRVFTVGERIVAKLQDYAAHPDIYADGSPRIPSDERRPGYVDFYTAQAYAFIAFAHASLGQLDQAREYSRLFDTTNYSRTFPGRKLMASTWCMLGDYDRMSAAYDEMQAAMGGDTVMHDYAVMLYNRAKAAGAKGQKALSASYWQRYASLLKQINNAERLAAAQESAARYHEREQQAALEAERAKHRRDVGIAWVLAAIVLIIVAFTVVLVYHLRQISRKNAVLSREIAENIGYKEEYLRLKSQPEIDAQQKDNESIPRLSTMNDTELFEFLRVVIVGEQLFLNPLFERQQLIDRFGLSKDSIGSAFAHGSRFASLPGYINECRLDYGARLLSVRPELSVAEVAAASGFASASVFTRNFKQRFTMTPTEFRERQSKARNAE